MSGKFFNSLSDWQRLRGWRSERASVYGAVVLAACVVVGTAAMAWIGYRAIRAWERSTRLSLERRADEVLALLAVALNRDMKGAQISVLVPISQYTLQEPPYDLADVVARAFARFPYPESFFAWQDDGSPQGITYFFNRADRPPAWASTSAPEEPYPVMMVADPPQTRSLVERARSFGRSGSRFAVFEWRAAGMRYHTIVHLLYGRPDDSELAGLIGFTVNLDWVRQEYFVEILRQVHRIDGREGGLSLSVLDEGGRPVAAIGEQASGGPVRERAFSLIFFDQSLVSSLPPGAPLTQRWVARVNASRDPALVAASLGAKRTLILIAGAAFATFAALILILRAVRASAELAVLKSEFVSTVTHELKTPLALIRLVSDTLAKGRYTSPETIREYAGLLSHESAHLNRLIDNLLTSARLTDVKAVYSFEVLDAVDLVEDSIERFRPTLTEMGFTVATEVPSDLPQIRGDRAMLSQVLDNLLDNAIKHGSDTRSITVRGSSNGRSVHLAVCDRGQGIPKDELPRVFDKFFRGRRAKAGGSGLGLAIVRQVIQDHGGSVEIRSVEDEETTVDVAVPIMEPR